MCKVWTLAEVKQTMLCTQDSDSRNHAMRAVIVTVFRAILIGRFSLTLDLDGNDGVHVQCSGLAF